MSHSIHMLSIQFSNKLFEKFCCWYEKVVLLPVEELEVPFLMPAASTASTARVNFPILSALTLETAANADTWLIKATITSKKCATVNLLLTSRK